MRLLRARFERHARGWAQWYAAGCADITLSRLTAIENNNKPDPVALRALAEVYGFAPADAHVLLGEVPAWPETGGPDMRTRLLVAIRAKHEEEGRS